MVFLPFLVSGNHWGVGRAHKIDLWEMWKRQELKKLPDLAYGLGDEVPNFRNHPSRRCTSRPSARRSLRGYLR